MGIATHGNKEFEAITTQILWMQRYLQELYAIDDNSPKFTQEYRDIAPEFFRMLSGLLYDAAILGVARLLDPAKQRGNNNMSMEAAIQACNWLDNSTKDKCADQLQKLRVSKPAKNIVEARNKLLAHADFDSVADYPHSARQYAPPYDTLPGVVSDIAALRNNLRPCGSLAIDVHQAAGGENWKGVVAILEHLVVGEDGGRL